MQLVGKSTQTQLQYTVRYDAFNRFQILLFSSCHSLRQLPASHHVKYFIRLEWDPDSQWGYSARPRVGREREEGTERERGVWN